MLGWRQVLRGLGRGKGFEWGGGPLEETELLGMRKVLRAALQQVESALGLPVTELYSVEELHHVREVAQRGPVYSVQEVRYGQEEATSRSAIEARKQYECYPVQEV